MSIKACINMAEETATPHIIEAARAEHVALKKVARLASELTYCMNGDKDGGYFLCEEAAPVFDDLLDALGELK